MRLLRPFESPGFRRLFVGVVATRIGDAMATLTLVWVTLHSHGPAALGLTLLLTAVPAIVISPLAGRFISRQGVRAVVVVDNTARLGAVLVLAIALTAQDTPSLALLFGYAILAGLTGPATEIAVDASMPETVPDADLTEANAVVSLGWDLSDLVSPVSAGALLTLTGAPAVLLIVAGCYLVMVVMVPDVSFDEAGDPTTRLSDHEPAPAVESRVGVLSGFRLLLTTYRSSLHLAMISLFVLAASGAQEVLLPLLVSERFGSGPAELGLLTSVFGAATLVGTAVISPRVGHLLVPVVLAVSLVIRGTGLALLGGSTRFAAAAATGSVAMAADGPWYPVVRTTQQRIVPPLHRPVVAGARGALGVAGYPLGNAVGGLLGTQLAPGTALIVIGALHLAPALVLVFPGLRHLPGADPSKR